MGSWMGGWTAERVSYSAGPGKQSQGRISRTGKNAALMVRAQGCWGLLGSCPTLRIWEEAARFVALDLGSSWGSALPNLPPWRSSCLWRTASPTPSPKSDRTGYPGFHPKPLAKPLWDALENSAKSLRSTRCVILKIDLRVTWRSPQRA